jgi:hypothetical protein
LKTANERHDRQVGFRRANIHLKRKQFPSKKQKLLAKYSSKSKTILKNIPHKTSCSLSMGG